MFCGFAISWMVKSKSVAINIQIFVHIKSLCFQTHIPLSAFGLPPLPPSSAMVSFLLTPLPPPAADVTCERPLIQIGSFLVVLLPIQMKFLWHDRAVTLDIASISNNWQKTFYSRCNFFQSCWRENGVEQVAPQPHPHRLRACLHEARDDHYDGDGDYMMRVITMTVITITVITLMLIKNSHLHRLRTLLS